MRKKKFTPLMEAVFWLAAILFTLLLCVSVGSVRIPLRDVWTAVWNSLWGLPVPEGISRPIIVTIRLPRVLCAGLMGAALSLCGGAMQGLLRNPLADGSTLGVSSGAALGAALSILLGITLPGFALGGTAITAMAFSFLSMLMILGLSYALDRSLSTQTIILIGVIYSMFISSILSLLITFSGEKLRAITFWTMGSLNGSNLSHAGLLAGALALFGVPLLLCAPALNAFLLGEENAANLGVAVKRVKLTVMVFSSALIGVSVSVGGSIGFVGLVVPHLVRLVRGPDHKRLLPLSMAAGAVFLMLADLLARTVFSPLELPIGVVTSLIGAVVFVLIFIRSRKGGGVC